MGFARYLPVNPTAEHISESEATRIGNSGRNVSIRSASSQSERHGSGLITGDVSLRRRNGYCPFDGGKGAQWHTCWSRSSAKS